MFMSLTFLALSVLCVIPQCFGAKQCQCDCTKCFQNRSKVLAAAEKYKKKEISVRSGTDSGVNRILLKQLKENLPFIEERLSLLKEMPVGKPSKSRSEEGDNVDDSEEDNGGEEEESGKQEKVKVDAKDKVRAESKSKSNATEIAVTDSGDNVSKSGKTNQTELKVRSQSDETRTNKNVVEPAIINKSQANIEKNPEMNNQSLNVDHDKQLNIKTTDGKSEDSADLNKNNSSVLRKKEAGLLTSETKYESPDGLTDKKVNLREGPKGENFQNVEIAILKNTSNTTSQSPQEDLHKSLTTPTQDVKGSLKFESRNDIVNVRKLTAENSTGEDESLVENISREIAKAIAEEERLMEGKNVTIERLRKARIHYAVVQAVKKLDNAVEKVGSRDPDSYSKKIKEHVIKSEELRKVQGEDEGLAVRGGHKGPKVELAPIATDYMRLVMARSFNKPHEKTEKNVADVDDQQ